MLVALVIIGVALAAAMRGAMSLTSTADYTRQKLLAVLTAENRLLELRLGRERLEPGESMLPCEQGGASFVCRRPSNPLRTRFSGAWKCACFGRMTPATEASLPS